DQAHDRRGRGARRRAADPGRAGVRRARRGRPRAGERPRFPGRRPERHLPGAAPPVADRRRGVAATAARPAPGRAHRHGGSPRLHASNTSKRDLTLDLTRPEGRALALRLIEQADLVVENYTPRVIEQFDLGWDVVHATNPRAVMVRMPAFGLDGPWRDRPGFA